MNYIFSIDFNTEEDTVFIKDSTGHYGTRQIYGIKYRSIEQLEEKIFLSMNSAIKYYKKLCDKEKKDEAN